VLVHDRQPDRPQFQLVDPGRDLLGRGLPARATQTVTTDETWLAYS
jgi:hypothetical protein